MVESFVDKSTKLVPDTIKQSIGKLIVVNAGETDPARKIHYASALITHIRSALFYVANSVDEREFTDVMKALLYNILVAEYDYRKIQFAFNRVEKLFEDKPRTRYDAQLLSDMELIQQCRGNWRVANRAYFENTDAWMQSNEMLADIQDILVEIATRWNLVIIPKDMPFNISQMPNIMIPGHTPPVTPLDE
jgi:hypothetical protein